MTIDLGPHVEECAKTYDPVTGTFVDDPCPTELPVLEMWYTLAKSMRAESILETGTHKGLSACYLAAAIRDGAGGGCVHTIDPKRVPHLWDGTNLEPFIKWYANKAQEAPFPDVELDVLIVDSLHIYNQVRWELARFEPMVREGGLVILHDTLIHDGVGRAAYHLYESGRFEVTTYDTPRRYKYATIDYEITCGQTIGRKIREGPPISADPEWKGMPIRKPKGPDPMIRMYISGHPNASA